MAKYFCALELYCNMTPAELIWHLLFYARLTWEEITAARTDPKESFLQFSKEDKKFTVISIEIWEKVINTWNDDQLNMIQKTQHTFQCITSTKCSGWKSSMIILQDLLRTTNPERFGSIGQFLLKIYFLNGKNNSFWENEFQTYENRSCQNKTLLS